SHVREADCKLGCTASGLPVCPPPGPWRSGELAPWRAQVRVQERLKARSEFANQAHERGELAPVYTLLTGSPGATCCLHREPSRPIRGARLIATLHISVRPSYGAGRPVLLSKPCRF